MMWAPVVNNLVSIAVFVGYLVIWGSQPATTPFSTSQAVFLSVGMTVAVALQAVIMVPYLRKAEIKLRPRFDWKGTGLGSTVEAFKWVLLAALISQIVTFMQTKLASVAVGKDALAAGQAVYNYAYTIWMVPHGLITVSLATALMPDLTRMALAGNMKAVARETTSTLRLTLTCMIPITAALAFLSMPLCRLLFGWGANQTSWRFIAWTLIAFALAYPVYTFFYIVNRAFYAMEDTKTAFKVTVVTDVVLLIVAVSGVVFIGKSGWVAPTLALALLLGMIPGSVYGWRLLNRRLHTSLAEVFRLSVRLSLAALPAGLAAHYSCSVLESAMPGPVGTLLGLVVAGFAGVGIFFAISRVLHIEDVAELVGMVKNRLNRNRQSVVQSGENPAAVDVEPEMLVEEPALADLVEPMALIETAPEELAEDTTPVSQVVPGDLLGERYRLDLLMARRSGTLTWRAFDTILQRDVLIHILAPGAERSFEILAAARQASVATDSRFLRVLDAVHSDTPTLGSYVICEFTQGFTLEQLLHSGPLTALETGWLGRELAEALIGVHASGLYHERLNPDTILISSNGNVKIVGFLMEKAIRPLPSDDTFSEVEREASDLDAVGKLLYASLITAWPGGPGFGMPAAPKDAHGYLTPRQVKAGISPALDLVVDQLLSRPPRSKQAPLRTASELFAALTKIVGTADAAPDL
ncbi:MAG: murein biosynthesis integral membrane protein MurJ, partial [Propionibacteriaceae bacterium]